MSGSLLPFCSHKTPKQVGMGASTTHQTQNVAPTPKGFKVAFQSPSGKGVNLQPSPKRPVHQLAKAVECFASGRQREAGRREMIVDCLTAAPLAPDRGPPVVGSGATPPARA